MGYPHIRGTVVAAEWQPSFIHLWLGIGCPDFLRPFEDTPPPSAIVTLEYRRIKTEKEQSGSRNSCFYACGGGQIQHHN